MTYRTQTLLILLTLLILGCKEDESNPVIPPSTDVTWTKYVNNPILDIGTPGTWDDVWIKGCTVILDSSIYKMWYSGHTETPSHNDQIGFATSPDGITWTKYSSNPVLTNNGGGIFDSALINPCIIKDGLVYRMWYISEVYPSYLNPYHNDTLRYATSSDGINWTKSRLNISPYVNPGQFAIVKEATLFRIWLSHKNTGECYTSTSTDGISWTPLSQITMLGYGGFNPGVGYIFKDGSLYRDFYQNPPMSSIYERRSSDGISWTDAGKLAIATDTSGWARGGLIPGSIIKNGNNYLMWFTGGATWPSYKIGVAHGIIR